MSRRIMLRILSLLMVCITHTTLWCMEVSITGHNAKCHGNSDGSIDIIIHGNSKSITIKLYDRTPAVKQKTLDQIITTDSLVTFQNLTAKKYYIVVTDSDNHYYKNELIINEPDALTYLGMHIESNPSNSESKDGKVSVEVKGGTLPYTYKWGANAENQKTQTAKNLAYGIYNCEINDANKCGPLRPSIMFLPKPENK